VTTLASTVEIVTGFRDEDELASWLADRQLATRLPLPMSSSLTGPDCCTAREERMLAWLLQHGDPTGEVTTSLRPQTFCT
jgi:hypothetical protein